VLNAARKPGNQIFQRLDYSNEKAMFNRPHRHKKGRTEMSRHKKGRTKMGFWKKLFVHSHHGSDAELTSSDKKLAIVGNPNVGKSVIFNNLTGAYVTVSNYPGTTVGISTGKGKMVDKIVDVVDTPGMYSLLPITEEERIGRSILLTGRPDVILHVVDAKNLERMLSFTFQLIEAGLPVILVLNIMDEAERMGIRFDASKLEDKLGIPVVPTVGTTKRGMNALKDRIAAFL